MAIYKQAPIYLASLEKKLTPIYSNQSIDFQCKSTDWFSDDSNIDFNSSRHVHFPKLY